MAFHLLTDEKAHDKDYFIRGPEILSYDEVKYPALVGRTKHF